MFTMEELVYYAWIDIAWLGYRSKENGAKAWWWNLNTWDLERGLVNVKELKL